jgi:hypothetical protein
VNLIGADDEMAASASIESNRSDKDNRVVQTVIGGNYFAEQGEHENGSTVHSAPPVGRREYSSPFIPESSESESLKSAAYENIQTSLQHLNHSIKSLTRSMHVVDSRHLGNLSETSHTFEREEQPRVATNKRPVLHLRSCTWPIDNKRFPQVNDVALPGLPHSACGCAADKSEPAHPFLATSPQKSTTPNLQKRALELGLQNSHAPSRRSTTRYSLESPVCPEFSMKFGARRSEAQGLFFNIFKVDGDIGRDAFESDHVRTTHCSDDSLLQVLEGLPTKRQCDTLFQAYFYGIHVAIPVFHQASTLSEYEAFWASMNSSGSLITPWPSLDFVPLLYALCYAGSLSCPADTFEAQFAQVSRQELSKRLREKVTLSLSIVSFPHTPKLSYLIAYLLGNTVPVGDPRPEEACLSLMLRVALTLGLHRQSTQPQFSGRQDDIRRRVWWHIIELDATIAIGTGLAPTTPYYFDHGVLNVSETDDHAPSTSVRHVSETPNQPHSDGLQSSQEDSADAYLIHTYAWGRYCITSEVSRQTAAYILLIHFTNLRNGAAGLSYLKRGHCSL